METSREENSEYQAENDPDTGPTGTKDAVEQDSERDQAEGD